MKKIVALLMSTAVLFVLGGCANDTSGAETNSEIFVATSFFPMYDFTRNIVGEAGTVSMIVPPGAEAHHFEPTPSNLAEIERAGAFVYLSAEMEFWVPSVLDSVDTNNLTIIQASEDIEFIEWNQEGMDFSLSESEHSHGHEESDDEHGHSHSHGESEDIHGESSVHDHVDSDNDVHEHGHSHSHDYDPHIWLSPALAIRQVERIRDGLIEAYPQARETFTANAAAYIAKLQVLDTEFRTAFEHATHRTFVVQHAGFAYLAREYSLNQVAISGLSEPTAARLAELRTFVLDNHIEVVYFEQNANESAARTLAEEVGVRLEVLNSLESLSSEEMAQGEDFISVMRQNLEALKQTIH